MATTLRRPNWYAQRALNGGDWKTGLSAAEINQGNNQDNQAPDVQDSWNARAAAQYAAIRQAQGLPAYANAHDEMVSKAQDSANTDLAGAKNTEDRRAYLALSNALGHTNVPLKRIGPVPDPTAAHWDDAQGKYVRDVLPNMDQLKAEFYQLPQEQQASIYAKGGAQFIDPEAGQKLLEGISKTKTDAFNEGIKGMIGEITKGDVQFNPSNRKFYRYLPDPSDPTGSLKTKQEITPLEYNYIQEGMKRGMMPDIDLFSKPPTAPDAKGSSSPVADTVSALASAKNAFQPQPTTSQPAGLTLNSGQTYQPNTSLMNAGVNMAPMDLKQLPPDASKVPSNDPFVRLHDYFGSSNMDTDAQNALDKVNQFIGNAGTAGADAFVDIANTGAKASNAIGRLMFGRNADQLPMQPKFSDQPPDDPRWLAIQAEQARNNPNATIADETLFQGP